MNLCVMTRGVGLQKLERQALNRGVAEGVG